MANNGPDPQITTYKDFNPRVRPIQRRWYSGGEIQRRKRVAKYKYYSVEGKMKNSLSKGLRWFKNTCSRIVHGFKGLRNNQHAPRPQSLGSGRKTKFQLESAGNSSRARRRKEYSGKRMDDQDLELEKARLISLALEFGFDEDSANKCLDRLVQLYGDDGRDFITVEHCGDDFLASLAEFMQDTEDWDDVQAMESEACGALTEILDKDLLQNYDSNVTERRSQIHIINDSPESQKHQNVMQLDSSSDDEEPDQNISRKYAKPSSNVFIDGNSYGPSPSSIKPPSISDYRSDSTPCSRSSVSQEQHSSSHGKTHGTLTYEELQKLDDIELVNVVVFGNRSFRPLQHQTCKAFLGQHDCFVLMPTGGGKSLCYQLPAILRPGVTIVISPLLSLIQDQIVTLNLKYGIAATFLNSQQKPSQAAAILQELRKDKPSCKLLYVTPERVAGNLSFQEILKSLHRKDILNSLRIPHAIVLETSFDRPNLKYEVIGKTKEPLNQLGKLLMDHFKNLCGIVYCLSKNECMEVSKFLSEKFKIKAAYYHAGLAARQRIAVQNKWHSGEAHVVCATIAFGMGIDKPDVVSRAKLKILRFVIHNTMSKSIESYYQESGRAGRDNLSATCVLLYQRKDFSRVDECRRQALLEHFGESFDRSACKNGSSPCDNCLKLSSRS
ncbi:hypothetical protein DH2020_003226 [Rehmannia glutinosa]|uniref:DNA 3'-5' helicase n=1 Tax=Rehmannia glutinosa TaxID=99300 RepID=A0ABR0XL55_REHGL